MKYIKSADWLMEHLDDENVRVIDCTYSLTDPEYGRQVFALAHIAGAVHLDLHQDLSAPAGAHGGRHPLPDTEKLKETFGNAGISKGNTVVIYDEGEGSFAGRCWWLLTYMGHKECFLLDGGLKEWQTKGFPLDNKMTKPPATVFQGSPDASMLADINEVKRSIDDHRITLIDSRDKKRYLGEEEPLDRVAGHIPGAVNYEWTDAFMEGKWRNVQAQKDRFSSLNPDEPIIVYCGSGVTATPNIISLMEAGFHQVKLYAGSYSDWVSYPDHPVETSQR